LLAEISTARGNPLKNDFVNLLRPHGSLVFEIIPRLMMNCGGPELDAGPGRHQGIWIITSKEPI
jgi:hypothetical protein